MGIYYSKVKENSKISKQTIAYLDYINEHIGNVKLSFSNYGNNLANILEIDYDELNQNIEKHDLSKFENPEFSSYKQYFFPEDDEVKDKDIFEIGWLYHQNLNQHHPEFWVSRDDNNTKILDMPRVYIAEMLLDWAAMGIKFNNTAYSYYKEEGHKKPFSKNTIKAIESVIDIFK